MVRACDSAHFALRFGPFHVTKRPILQCEMGRFATYCVPVSYVWLIWMFACKAVLLAYLLTYFSVTVALFVVGGAVWC